MNTIQLECFLAVAEHLNFSRASEVLRITQPAVSHQIQSLEEELDVKLFKRTSKSVSLTQEGIQFLPDAQLILKTALSAKERLGQHEQFIPFELGCHNRTEKTDRILSAASPGYPDRSFSFPSESGRKQTGTRCFRHKRRTEKVLPLLSRTLFCSHGMHLFPRTSAGAIRFPDKGSALRQHHCLLTASDRRSDLLDPEQYCRKTASGTAVLFRKHGKCPDTCQGADWLYFISRYHCGPGAGSDIYTRYRYPEDVFWRILPV